MRSLPPAQSFSPQVICVVDAIVVPLFRGGSQGTETWTQTWLGCLSPLSAWQNRSLWTPEMK